MRQKSLYYVLGAGLIFMICICALIIGLKRKQERMLEALKLRGVERQAGEPIKFEIRPEVGIQILPFVKVKI